MPRPGSSPGAPTPTFKLDASFRAPPALIAPQKL